MAKKTGKVRSHVMLDTRDYLHIFNNIQDPVLIYELDNDFNFLRFIEVNDVFYEKYGYSKEDINNIHLLDINADNDDDREEKMTVLIEKGSYLFETVHRTRKGKLFPVEINSILLKQEQNPRVISIIRDIKERKKFERKLINLIKEKDEILKIVSHDLSSPLSQINGLIELIEKEDDNARISEYVQLIKKISGNAENTVMDLLGASLGDAEQPLKLDKFNIVDCLRKLSDNYRILVQSEKNLSYLTDLPDKDIFINGNENKIIRVFDNLISNAIKFSREHGSISITITEEKKTVCVAVKDEGIGIPDQFKPHMFKKHSKASRKGTSGEASTGLGLYIVKDIVEKHNGKVSFESKINEGTTFYVRFPILLS
ncbi:MAG: PAS domain-containing sensor histidine kinase [Bacteroidota bacterium]